MSWTASFAAALLAANPVTAQSPAPDDVAAPTPDVHAPTLDAQPEAPQLEESPPTKTWYVMINITELPGDASCGNGGLYSISTKAPFTVEGPDTITPNHAAVVAEAWFAHLLERSPTAFYWIESQPTRSQPSIYFRESRVKVMRDFARDGHLEYSRRCERTLLVKSPVESFTFVPPEGFAHADFGEPVPEAAKVEPAETTEATG